MTRIKRIVHHYRLWKLRRAYRTIAKMEAALVGWPQPVSMRMAFVRQSARNIQILKRLQGMSRQERRQELRAMFGGR